MSISHKGKPPWNKDKKSLHPAWNKGKKTPESVRKKLREAWEKRKPDSDETRKKKSDAVKLGYSTGKRVSPLIKQVGEGHWCWKGGISTYKRKLYLNERRRAKKFMADGNHSQEEWENLKSKVNNTCQCCRKQEPEITLSEDHIVPLSKGGSDNIENIQPLCRSCNSKKRDKIINFSETYVKAH